jgi:DDE superfamily endonuclease
MIAMDWDFNVVFCLPGGAGSMHDNAVLERAFEQSFEVPVSHYYLADAGYYSHNGRLLVPYIGARYHLPKWCEAQVVGILPRNQYELFNITHSVSRSLIERGIGRLKGQ